MVDRTLKMTRSRLKILAYLQTAEAPDTSGAQISQQTGVGAGRLYPDLIHLERAGWLDSEWETLPEGEPDRPRRRYYRLTDDGRDMVRAALAAPPRPRLLGLFPRPHRLNHAT